MDAGIGAISDAARRMRSWRARVRCLCRSYCDSDDPMIGLHRHFCRRPPARGRYHRAPRSAAGMYAIRAGPNRKKQCPVYGTSLGSLNHQNPGRTRKVLKTLQGLFDDLHATYIRAARDAARCNAHLHDIASARTRDMKFRCIIDTFFYREFP